MSYIKKWLLKLPGYSPREYSEHAIRLDLNESPYPPPKEVVEAICREAINVNRYPETALYNKFVSLVAQYVNLPEDCVIPGAGSSGVLATIFTAIVSPGSKVVSLNPSFSMYNFYANLMGAQLVNVQLTWKYDKWFLDIDTLMHNAIDAELIIIDRPNNPTGATLLSREEIEDLTAKAKGVVVIDEAYYEFAGDSVADLILKYDNLIVTRSLSKAFSLAGLRIGYGLANPTLADVLRKITPPFTISRPALAAAIAALEHPDYVQKLVKLVISEREKLRQHLIKMGLKVYPSKTNFLLVETNISNIVDKLVMKGVYVRKVPLGDNWFRVTVGLPEENMKLVKVLKRLITH